MVGYFATRAEAEAALVHYNECPYDLSRRNLTFEEFYNIWSERYLKDATYNYCRSIESTYLYCSALNKVKMRDLRTYHLKDCIENAFIIVKKAGKPDEKRKASANVKSRMKSVFNLMFDYAYEHELVDRNHARAFNIDKSIVEQIEEDKRVNEIFSPAEIEVLWDMKDNVKFVDMILIGIYSGWRPQELAILKVADIDLEANTMFGGLKTKAGKNRYVPIHPLIKPLIENRLKEASELKSDYLFNDPEGQQGMNLTYDKYRKRFEKAVNRLGMGYHHPHETRHTFITKAKDAGIDEYIIKLIVGHAIADITEKVYTHRKIEQLQAEILKIKA